MQEVNGQTSQKEVEEISGGCISDKDSSQRQEGRYHQRRKLDLKDPGRFVNRINQ